MTYAALGRRSPARRSLRIRIKLPNSSQAGIRDYDIHNPNHEPQALERGNKNWSPDKRGSTTLSTVEARQAISRSRSSAKTTTEPTSCRSYANGAIAHGSMQRPTDG
jgi:hypothetical protein